MMFLLNRIKDTGKTVVADSRRLSARLWLGIVFNAALLVFMIWSAYPIRQQPITGSSAINWSTLLFLLSFFAIPLLIFGWAVFTPWRWQHQALFLRRALLSLIIFAAFLILLSVMQLLWGVFRTYSGLLLIGIFSIAFCLIGVIALPFLPWKNATLAQSIAYRRMYILILGGSVAALFLWSYLSIGVVVFQAERIADGKPYCIQTTAEKIRSPYKEISNLRELSGLEMQSSYGNRGSMWFYSNYHGILALAKEDGGRDYYNWSYRRQNFTPVSAYYRPSLPYHISCKPKLNFAKMLPW